MVKKTISTKKVVISKFIPNSVTQRNNKRLLIILGGVAFALILALAGFLYYSVIYSTDLGNTDSSAGIKINCPVGANVTCVPDSISCSYKCSYLGIPPVASNAYKGMTAAQKKVAIAKESAKPKKLIFCNLVGNTKVAGRAFKCNCETSVNSTGSYNNSSKYCEITGETFTKKVITNNIGLLPEENGLKSADGIVEINPQNRYIIKGDIKIISKDPIDPGLNPEPVPIASAVPTPTPSDPKAFADYCKSYCSKTIKQITPVIPKDTNTNPSIDLYRI